VVVRNIVSGGPSIIRKPGAHRTNLEFTSSLRSNFLAAQQDYAALKADGSGNGNGTANGNGLPDSTNAAEVLQSASTWTVHEDGILYVPRIDWSTAGLQEEPSQYEITVKLFFLPTTPVTSSSQYAREALGLVLKELRVPCVDLLIISFPGMSFEGDCEWEADKINAVQGNDEEEVSMWLAVEDLHREGLVKNMGIAEFGSEKLARFLQRTKVRPTVDQINIKNCCNVPPPLVKLAKEENIELFVHSDCTDVLPKGTLRELLGPEPQGAGLLADAETGRGGLQGDLLPQWVVKYTAVVKNRGVIENKGYFASAELAKA
jgi:glutamate--cysteine ligase regulatory subunit